MCTRKIIVLLAGIITFSRCSLYSQAPLPKPDKVDLVEPRVDAANSRFFFFSSACRPFGMVNLNPDMVLSGTWGSGYRYNEDTIKCFSHIHCWELSGIPVLPTTGVFKGFLGPDHYGSSYSHDEEVVHPGYHKVVLKDYGITAELTSTMRVGFHRYTFPASRESDILFDFTTVLGSSQTDSAVVHKRNSRELEGHVVMAATTRRPKPITVYFVADFDKAFDSFGGWKDGSPITVKDSVSGRHTGVYVRFATAKGEVRQMKVAISYVSVVEARNNMRSELPDWDFQRVVKDSRREWNAFLGRIDVEGGSLTEQRRFYTDLWHALQGRRVVNDVSGTYIDMTGARPRVGHIPKGKDGKLLFSHYNSDSYWGAQWSLNTLWDLVYPEVTESFINSMLMMYDDGGLIPRGPSGGNYTYVMTGATTTPFIVSAYMKGIRGFDIQKAYEGMRKDHFPGGMMSKAGYEFNTSVGGGIEDYIKLGYVPWPLSDKKYGLHQDGSAQTLEYAYQDYALAQIAGVLGKKDDYTLFMRRAENYKNIFNKDIGWMWTKTREGRWNEPADVLLYEHGWVEGNAAQYTWFVPHDVPGLIGLMGGDGVFTERLNGAFENARGNGFVSGDVKDRAGKENRRVYINYGNQPCMETPFLFNYSGAPWLTQYWCRQVIDSVYSGISPQKGYGGDEDQGLMGALSVLLKIGLFSTNGGVSQKPFYEISSPIFNKITLHLNRKYYPGGSFVIEAKGNGPGRSFIRDARLNGQALDRPWIYHSTLVKGGKLVLTMGAEPNKEWGAGAEKAPPGMSSDVTDEVRSGPGAGGAAMKETPVRYVDAFSNEGHPEVAYWFFDAKMLSRERYRGKIDSFAKFSKYTLIFLTARGPDFYDTVLMHPVFKDLVAYAHSKGLKIGLQIWKDDKGVLPENTNRLIQEGEVVLDDRGEASYDVHAEGCRDPKTIFKSELFKIYAFQKTAGDTGVRAGNVESPGGWYKAGTLKDITGMATVQADTDEVKLTIRAGRRLKGYTAYIMTQHYYMSCSNFSDQAKAILTRVFGAYKDIPFDGVALDEYKGLRIARPQALGKGVFRERLYTTGMGVRLQDIMGMPAERALFDMRYAPVGQPEVRIRAIDEYMHLLRTATLDVERTMYETGKRLYGKDCFIGVHNTFHNNLDQDEVWQTGVSWWNIRRDYGHTDEETSTPIQLGIGMCYPMNAMYNMYYNKSLDRIWTKALYDLRFGVRTHYHAANDMQGWGVSIDAPEALEKINLVENGARLMNRFNPPFPGIKLLVVYGMPAQYNWWPDQGQRGRYDVNDKLNLEGKCVELWKNGLLNVAVPSDVIEDGRLTLNAAGKPVLSGYVFDAVIFLYPQYSLPKVTAFFRQYVDGGGKLLMEGPATRDFYGKDMTAEWKGIAEKAVATSFSLENVLRLGTGKNELSEGVINEDGSYTFTSPESLASDRPAVFSFTRGKYRFMGQYKGVAVIKVDDNGRLQKLAATGFSALSRDGEEVLRLSREADIYVSGGEVTVADAGHSIKVFEREGGTVYEGAGSADSGSVWMDDLPLQKYSEGIPSISARANAAGDTMRIGGVVHSRGVGVRCVSVLAFYLNGKGSRFTALAGVDDKSLKSVGVKFYVIGDRKILFESGEIHAGDAPRKVDVDLRGVERLGLLVTADTPMMSKASPDWADARFQMVGGSKPGNIPNTDAAYILTPPVGAAPRINSAKVFGATRGNPFLFTVAASGRRPMRYGAVGLPAGLSMDGATGIITGKVDRKGDYRVTVTVQNASGKDMGRLMIRIGDTIALTPPMGWNGWNSWARNIDREKVMASAHALVETGLRDHGWTYINIDDAWQGQRTGEGHALQPNEKFPQFKKMVDSLHSMGLKAGVYSTPWISSYAGFAGGSSDFADGVYPDSIANNKRAYRHVGKYRFEEEDARQMAAWGIDFLKYDWHIDVSSGQRMSEALRHSGRDIVYSLSNSAPFANATDWVKLSNMWRTGPDIRDSWNSLYVSAFTIDKWAPYGGRGHWNDPDMMIVGKVTTAAQLHPTRLTPDEQYSHVSIYSLLAAPMIIGCPIEQLDAFGLNLLTNDEVIAIDQDPLGRPGRLVSDEGGVQTWIRPMEDGSYAVGLFNTADFGRTPVSYFRWGDEKPAHYVWDLTRAGLKGRWKLRDVWRQKDLGISDGVFSATIPYHGVLLLRVFPEK